jgi:hypothetical protein
MNPLNIRLVRWGSPPGDPLFFMLYQKSIRHSKIKIHPKNLNLPQGQKSEIPRKNKGKTALDINLEITISNIHCFLEFVISCFFYWIFVDCFVLPGYI